MRISPNFIDELVIRADIVELIDSYVTLRKAGREYKACCPFHNEKTASFTVSSEKQFYHCFGCGVHGNAIGFLMEFARLSYVEAIEELASRTGMQVVYEEGTTSNDSPKVSDELYNLLTKAADYYFQQWKTPHSKAAKDYLKQRGLSGQIAKEFQIGYAPLGWDNLLKTFGTATQESLLKVGLLKKNEKGRVYDCFRDRIMFPIHDRRGRVIAFGGRLLTDKEKEPKYLNSPETPLFKKGNELYSWYFARKIRPLKNFILVEGYMDVVMLAQYGIRNVVATLGTATTNDHLNRLFHDVADLIFCFDGDDAGRKAAWRALKNVLPFLKEGRQVTFAFLPQGEDPDSFVRKAGTEAFYRYLDQALPLSKFLFDTLTQQVDLSTLEGQARLVELAKPLLSQLPTGPYRDSMFRKLTELTGVNSNKLDKLIPLHSSSTHSVRPPLKSTQRPSSFREFSLEYQAIACLLYQPSLSLSIESPFQKLSAVQQKDISLLFQLIEFARSNPKLTVGAICEHYRNTEYEQTLSWLAGQNTFLTNTTIDINKEFTGAIERLIKKYSEQQTKEEVMSAARANLLGKGVGG